MIQQAHTNYKSAYANQFTGKEGKKDDGKVAVSQAHSGDAISLGNHQLPMITTNNASYIGKKREEGGLGWKEGGEVGPGICLGDNGTSMETVNQQYFTAKPIAKNTLPEATMKELRNTHFNLGGMPQQYQTESNYYQHPQMQQSKPNPNGSKMNFTVPTY